MCNHNSRPVNKSVVRLVFVSYTMSEQNSSSDLKGKESGQSTSSSEKGKPKDEVQVEGETFDEFYKEVGMILKS